MRAVQGDLRHLRLREAPAGVHAVHQGVHSHPVALRELVYALARDHIGQGVIGIFHPLDQVEQAADMLIEAPGSHPVFGIVAEQPLDLLHVRLPEKPFQPVLT